MFIKWEGWEEKQGSMGVGRSKHLGFVLFIRRTSKTHPGDGDQGGGIEKVNRCSVSVSVRPH